MITQVLSKVRIFFAWIMVMLLPAFALADVANYTLVADYVPVVNTDSTGDTAGEVGLYDLVSGMLNLSATATPFNETEADPADITAIPNATILIDNVAAPAYTYTYNGTEQTPSVTVKMGEADLEKGSDYDIVGISSAKDVGLYTLSVVGKGTYSGEKSISWDIVPASVTATAKSYTVNLGTVAPTYEIDYEGFVDGETDAVLTNAPALTCTYNAATAQEGDSIDITFATKPAAKNYTFVCVPGTITVSSVYTITLNPISVSGQEGTGGSLSETTYRVSNEAIVVGIKNPTPPGGYQIAASNWRVYFNGSTSAASTDDYPITEAASSSDYDYELKIKAGTTGNIVVRETSYSENKVTVKYNNNYPSPNTNLVAQVAMDDSVGYYVSGDTTISACAFEVAGYRFLSWNTKANGKGITWNPGDTIDAATVQTKGAIVTDYGAGTISKTINLYAQWEREGYPLFYDNMFSVEAMAAKGGGMATSFRAWDGKSSNNGTIRLDYTQNALIISNDTTRDDVHIPVGKNTSYYCITIDPDTSYTLKFNVECLANARAASDWFARVYLWTGGSADNTTAYTNEKGEGLTSCDDGSYELTFKPSDKLTSAKYAQVIFGVNTKGATIKFSNIKLSKAHPDVSAFTPWGTILPANQAIGEDALAYPAENRYYGFTGWQDASGNAVTATDTMPATSKTIYLQAKTKVYVEGLVAESRPYDGTTAATINATNAKYVDADGKELTDLTTSFPTSGTFAQSSVKGGIGNPPEAVAVNYDFALNEADAAKYVLAELPTLSATITRAQWQVTSEPVECVYDGADHYIEFEVLNGTGSTFFYWNIEEKIFDMSPETAITHVDESGEYYILVTDGDLNMGGYNFENAIITDTVTITPAPLTAQATVNGRSDDSVSIFVGDPIPTLGIEYSGFVNGETPETAYNFTAPTASTTYTPDSPAGTYTVTVEGGSAGDYTITRQSTTFTVVEPTYTITMNPGEGGKVDGANPTYQCSNEALSIRLPSTTRTGYHISATKTRVEGPSGVTFKYHAASGGEGLYYTIEIPAGTRGDITITPDWDANTYTIKYKGNPWTKKLRGLITTTGSVTDQSCYYDRDVTLRANGFTRAGYAFAGWNTEKNGSGTLYEAGATTRNLTKNNNSTVTLYAQWTRTGYELGYDNYFSLADFAASDESLKLAKDESMTKGTVIADLAAGSLTITRKVVTASTTASTDVRTPYGSEDAYYTMQLKPTTSYQVTFDVGSDDENIKWRITAYTLDDTNYAKGMSNGSNLKGEQTFTFETTASGKAQLLFWNYVDNSSVTFSNIRVVEADRAKDAALSEAVRKLVTAGEAVGELEEPAKSGYAFLGWNTAEDGSGETYDETKTMPSASVPIFSQWVKRTATVRVVLDKESIALGADAPSYVYELEGSIADEDPAGFITGAPVYITAPEYLAGKQTGSYTVSVSGLTSDAYELAFEPASFTVVNSESVNKYSVTQYEEAGASGVEIFKYISADTNQTYTLAVPAREGYSITGWTINPVPAYSRGGAVAVELIDGGADYSLTIPAGAYGPIAVTPTWTQSSCLLTFHLNDGSDTTAVQAFEPGEPKNLKTLAELGFSRKNYRFKGWGTSSAAKTSVATDGESVTPFADGAEITSTIDYYAIWDVIPMVFYFDPNGGSLADNARIVLQGTPLLHNVNIFPSDADGVSYTDDGVKKVNSRSFENGVLSLDMVMRVSSGSGHYFCFNANKVSYLTTPPPVLNYSGVLEVLDVDSEKSALSSIKFGESNSQKKRTFIRSDPETIISLAITKKTVVVNCYTHNPKESPTMLMSSVFTQPKTSDKTEQAIKCDLRYSLYAGRAPEVAACFAGDDPETHTYKRHFDYIECALPEPTWAGMRFLGWNTKKDGSGRWIDSTMCPDGETLGVPEGTFTLYAVWDNDGSYYWDKPVGGVWDPSTTDESDNWYSRFSGYMGFPHEIGANVYVSTNEATGFASATEGITITSTRDEVIGSLSVYSTDELPVTLDFTGHSLYATTNSLSETNGLLKVTGTTLTLTNGNYAFRASNSFANKAKLVMQKGADLTLMLYTDNSAFNSQNSDTTGCLGLMMYPGSAIHMIDVSNGYYPRFGRLRGSSVIDGGLFEYAGTFKSGIGKNPSDYIYNLSLVNGALVKGLKDGTDGPRLHISNTLQMDNSTITNFPYVYIDARANAYVTNSLIHSSYLWLNGESHSEFDHAQILSSLRAEGTNATASLVECDVAKHLYINSSFVTFALTNSTAGGVLFFGGTNNVIELVDSIVDATVSQYFVVTNANNTLRLVGSSTITTSTKSYLFGENNRIIYSLPSDAEERDVPISVNSGVNSSISSEIIIGVEKGDYTITGEHAYLPLMYFATLPDALGTKAGVTALMAHAEVDAEFGIPGTDWRFITIGHTLYLELKPVIDEQYTITVNQFEEDGVAVSGFACNATKYAFNYENQNVDLTIPTMPQGYEFKGWLVENDQTDNFADMGLSTASGESLTIVARSLGNLTLTPVVQGQKRTVIYKSNCTTYKGSMSKQQFSYADTATTTLNLNGFNRLGYSFAGWSTTESGGVVYADGASVPDLPTDSEITLYAVWTRTTYGLGYENMFIFADFVTKNSSYRPYNKTSGSKGEISADLEAGTLTLTHLSNSKSADVHTPACDNENNKDKYYWWTVVPGKTYVVSFDVEKLAGSENANFKVDAYTTISAFSTRTSSGSYTGVVAADNVKEHHRFTFKPKTSYVTAQLRFWVYEKGSTFRFSNIRVYPNERATIVESLTDEDAWGQTFVKTDSNYALPLPEPKRGEDLVFAGWNTAEEAAGEWSDDSSFVPGAKSYTMVAHWKVAKPTLVGTEFAFNALKQDGVTDLPATTIATVSHTKEMNAGTYDSVATLVDKTVLWDDGTTHGSREDVVNHWTIMPIEISIGTENNKYNGDGFNHPDQWGLTRYWDNRYIATEPVDYRYRSTTDNKTVYVLVRDKDYTINFFQKKDGDWIPLDPTAVTAISEDDGYKTVMTGIGNFTGSCETAWDVKRYTFVWKSSVPAGAWNASNWNKPAAVSYLQLNWPQFNGQNASFDSQSGIAEEPIVVDFEHGDATVYQTQITSPNLVIFKNGQFNQGRYLYLGSSQWPVTLMLTNMTINCTGETTGARVYPERGGTLIIAGDTSFTGYSRLQYATSSSGTIHFENGNIDALNDISSSVVCNVDVDEVLERNLTIDNATVETGSIEPGTKAVFNYYFKLGERNTSESTMLKLDKIVLPKNSTFIVDAAEKDAGDYPLISASTVTDRMGLSTVPTVINANPSLSASIVMETIDNRKVILLRLARVYRALGNDSETPAIGVPDKWIEDFGLEPSSDPAVYEPIMEKLNTKDETSGFSPMEAYIMGFSGEEAKNMKNIKPLSVRSTMEKVIQEGDEDNEPVIITVPSISLKNMGTTDWPTRESSESSVTYELISADAPTSLDDAWVHIESSETPEFELPLSHVSSTSPVKFFRIKIKMEAFSDKNIPKQ